MKWILVIALVSPSAWSAGYCPSAEELLKKVDACEDNSVFQEAAVECIQKFDKEMESATKQFGAALVKPKATDQQADSYKTSEANLSSTEKTLDQLIASAAAGLALVTAYQGVVNWPEDFDSKEAVNGDPKKFLYESDCYRETYEVLFEVQEDFQQKLNQLSLARGVAVVKKSDAKSRDDKIQNEAGLVPVVAKPSSRGVVVPTKKAIRNSDISGTVVEKKK